MLRTARPVAATLSAGRDSGSVVAIAARLLAEEGRTLNAYTAVPRMAPDGADRRRIGNEWPLASQTAQMAGANVRHIPINSDGTGVLEGIEHFLDLHTGPSHAAVNQFWMKAIMEAAERDGAGLVLTGALGNGSVSWAGNGLALQVLTQGSAREALRYFFRSERDPLSLLKRQILKPAVLAARRAWYLSPLIRRQPWRDFSALNPAMARQLNLDKLMKDAGLKSTFHWSPLADRRLFFFDAAWSTGNGMWSEMGARHGLTFRDPTFHLPLIEFLLRVPEEQFRRHGQSSYLFRRAMAGYLPHAVLAGERKGLQAADIGHLILSELPLFQSCMERLEAHPASRAMLDLPLMRRCLTDLSASVNPITSARAANIMLRGMGVGIFLLRIDEP
jgi:asparagine synthase (glutamine-hydrolysing)